MGKSGVETGAKPSPDKLQPVKISSSQLASFGKSLDWSLNQGDISLHQAEYQHNIYQGLRKPLIWRKSLSKIDIIWVPVSDNRE